MTEKPLGTLLKELRQGKGLSQSQICDGFISRMTLSKIENNLNKPSYLTLSHILEKLAVSFDELAFLQQKDTTKQQILAKFSRIPDDSHQEELLEVIQLAQVYLKEQTDEQIAEIKSLAEVMLELPNLSITNLSSESQRKLAEIWQRLNKMNAWTLSELKMASTIVVYFPGETALPIGQRILKQLARYQEFAPLQSYLLTIYLNLTTIFIREESFLEAENLNQRALLLAKELELYHFYYFTLVRKGIFLKQQDLIDEGRVALTMLGKTAYLVDLTAELSN